MRTFFWKLWQTSPWYRWYASRKAHVLGGTAGLMYPEVEATLFPDQAGATKAGAPKTLTVEPMAPRSHPLPATWKQDVRLDLRGDTVVLDDGRLRAVYEVQGLPLNEQTDPQEAERFLAQWAGMIVALRERGGQFVARSRQGALQTYAQTRGQFRPPVGRTEARLAQANLRHIERIGAGARELAFYAVLPADKGQQAHLDADCQAFERAARHIGMRVGRLRGDALPRMYASFWNPDASTTHWFYGQRITTAGAETGGAVLHVEPHRVWLDGAQPGTADRAELPTREVTRV